MHNIFLDTFQYDVFKNKYTYSQFVPFSTTLTSFDCQFDKFVKTQEQLFKNKNVYTTNINVDEKRHELDNKISIRQCLLNMKSGNEKIFRSISVGRKKDK